MTDQYDGHPAQHAADHTEHTTRVRRWWDQTSESDQDAVLANLRLCRAMAGVPWAFLPEDVQIFLARRLRIKSNDER